MSLRPCAVGTVVTPVPWMGNWSSGRLGKLPEQLRLEVSGPESNPRSQIPEL